jgi:site-specific DNA recombinase
VTKGASYFRVSSQEQIENDSLNHQRMSNIRCADDNGIIIVKEFSDRGISAKEMSKRKGLLDMLEFVEREFSAGDFVLLYDASRLCRNLADAANIYDRLKAKGILIRTPSRIYTYDGNGFLIWAFDSVIAAYDNITKSEQTKDRMTRRARQEGRWLHGAPFGYIPGSKTVPESGKSLTIYEPEAQLVRRAFDSVLRGEDVRSVASWLMTEPPWRIRYNSNHLHAHTKRLRTMLRDTKYIGYFETVQTDGLRQGDWTPLVSTEVFEAVGRRFDNPKYVPDDDKMTRFPLLGLLFCDECGRQYTRSSPKGGRFNYYHCGNTGHRRVMIDCGVALSQFEDILETVGTPEPLIERVIEKIREQVDQELEEVRRVRLNLHSELQSERRQLDGYVNALIGRDSGISDATLTRLIAGKEDRIRDMETQLLKSEVPPSSYLETAIEISVGLLGDPLATWRSLKGRNRCTFARAVFGKSLVVRHGQVQTTIPVALQGISTDIGENSQSGTPNGIRTRAATLKGWVETLTCSSISTDQLSFATSRISAECDSGIPRA